MTRSEKDGQLVKSYHFASFENALERMNKAGAEISRLDHHPTWTNTYSTVDVSLCTHHLGNKIGPKDYELAHIMDSLYTSYTNASA